MKSARSRSTGSCRSWMKNRRPWCQPAIGRAVLTSASRRPIRKAPLTETVQVNKEELQKLDSVGALRLANRVRVINWDTHVFVKANRQGSRRRFVLKSPAPQNERRPWYGRARLIRDLESNLVSLRFLSSKLCSFKKFQSSLHGGVNSDLLSNIRRSV